MAAPPNGTCATAIDVTNILPYTVVVDTTLASTDTEVTPTCGASGGAKSVWWKISNSDLVNYTLIVIDTTGSSYYQVTSLWSGSCGGLVQVQCQNDTYSGMDAYITYALAPGLSCYILIQDNNTGSGGSLHLSITKNTLVENTVIISNNNASASHLQFLTAYNTGGTLIDYDTSIVPFNSNPFLGLVQRASDRFLLATSQGGAATKSTIFVLSPSMGMISKTLLDPPDLVPALGWKPDGLYFDSHGNLFMSWRSSQGGIGSHCFQKRNATDFSLIQQWLNFDTASFLGGNINGGAVSPDGSKFYYNWNSSGQTNRNVVRVLNLTTGVPTNFATYSTWNEGTGNGYTVSGHSYKVDSAGNLYIVFTHTTANVVDGCHFVKYSPNAVSLIDFALTGTAGSYATVVTNDTEFIWNAATNHFLDEYQISDGTRQAHIAIDPSFYSDLIVLGSSTPPPPPDQNLSGIYYIKIGKTNDTYYTNLTSGTTVDVKIPDPFADTALLGDE